MIAVATASPQIDRDDLTRLFGGRRRQRFSYSVRSKLHSAQRTLYELMNPRLFYHKNRLEKVDGACVYLEEGPIFKSAKLARAFRDAHETICFVASIGGRIDSEITLLMEQNRLSDAYILDTLGSLAVEDMAEQFQRRMETTYQLQGKSVTLRFSPGYCDWPITEQKKLFGLFDSATCGVELSDSCLMQPRKSISGIFAVLPISDDSSEPPYNPCRECSARGCSTRRTTG